MNEHELLLAALTALKYYRTRWHQADTANPNYYLICVIHGDAMDLADTVLAAAKAQGITIPEVGP